jgi:hypothetical protein
MHTLYKKVRLGLPVKEQSACHFPTYVVYADALSKTDSPYRFHLKENILLFHKTT